ncbi:MAG: V-type ATP synthase subunit F [Treponema sp.]|nr:V-type ATP synthase subunit F [Treponema sp.]
MEYFVIGERELVLGFMLAGVKGTPVSNRQEALEAFNAMTGQNKEILASGSLPKILILTEDAADMLAPEIQAWQMTGKSPLIVEVPGLHGHIEGRRTLTDAIREAIGIKV